MNIEAGYFVCLAIGFIIAIVLWITWLIKK